MLVRRGVSLTEPLHSVATRDSSFYEPITTSFSSTTLVFSRISASTSMVLSYFSRVVASSGSYPFVTIASSDAVSGASNRRVVSLHVTPHERELRAWGKHENRSFERHKFDVFE